MRDSKGRFTRPIATDPRSQGERLMDKIDEQVEAARERVEGIRANQEAIASLRFNERWQNNGDVRTNMALDSIARNASIHQKSSYGPCAFGECDEPRVGTSIYCERHGLPETQIANPPLFTSDGIKTFDEFLAARSIPGVYGLSLMTEEDRKAILREWAETCGPPVTPHTQGTFARQQRRDNITKWAVVLFMTWAAIFALWYAYGSFYHGGVK